jgi:hypothetical protein
MSGGEGRVGQKVLSKPSADSFIYLAVNGSSGVDFIIIDLFRKQT